MGCEHDLGYERIAEKNRCQSHFYGAIRDVLGVLAHEEDDGDGAEEDRDHEEREVELWKRRVSSKAFRSAPHTIITSYGRVPRLCAGGHLLEVAVASQASDVDKTLSRGRE